MCVCVCVRERERERERVKPSSKVLAYEMETIRKKHKCVLGLCFYMGGDGGGEEGMHAFVRVCAWFYKIKCAFVSMVRCLSFLCVSLRSCILAWKCACLNDRVCARVSMCVNGCICKIVFVVLEYELVLVCVCLRVCAFVSFCDCSTKRRERNLSVNTNAL